MGRPVEGPTQPERVLLMTVIDCSRARGNPRGNAFEPLEELAIVWLHLPFGDTSVKAFKAALEGLVELELIAVEGSKILVTDKGLLSAARWKERHKP